MMGRRRKTDLEPRPAPKPTPAPAVEISTCDARCAGCRYSGIAALGKDIICEYLSLPQRHRRPCHAGAECTVYEPRKAPRPKTPPIWQKLMKEDENG